MQNASEKEFGYETLAEGKTFQVVGENQFPPIFVLYSVTWVSARKIANAPNNIAKEERMRSNFIIYNLSAFIYES